MEAARAEGGELHGAAMPQSARGAAPAGLPFGMDPLEVGAAQRRRHDAAWELRLMKKHEARISPEQHAQYKSSKRRNWVNSSRRWIDRRKELAASMTPKERKQSRSRLYTTPRHYAKNRPRVYA